MAVIFKIVFVFLALCAIAYAVQPQIPHGAGSGPYQVRTLEGRHYGPIPSEDGGPYQVRTLEGRHYGPIPSEDGGPYQVRTLEGRHYGPTPGSILRYKRACKTITYTKNGKTYSAQKC